MKKIIVILCLILLPMLVIAHPHLFIEYQIKPVFSETGLEGIETEWTFDEMFSWQIAFDYTEDQDLHLTEAEQKIIEKEAFIYLQESEYFAEFFCEDERFRVKEVSNFWAEYRGELLVYHYYIPWKVPIKSEPTHLKICFFDDTMFCEIVPKKEGLILEAKEGLITEYMMPDRVTYQLNFWKK